MRWLSRIFFMVGLGCLIWAVPGCGKNHSEEVLASLEALETAMRLNVGDPEALLSAMDACIVRYRPVWEKSAHLLETRDKASFEKELSLELTALRAVSQRIVDLDLEIQDRYGSDLEVMRAYQRRLSTIGGVRAPERL